MGFFFWINMFFQRNNHLLSLVFIGLDHITMQQGDHSKRQLHYLERPVDQSQRSISFSFLHFLSPSLCPSVPLPPALKWLEYSRPPKDGNVAVLNSKVLPLSLLLPLSLTPSLPPSLSLPQTDPPRWTLRPPARLLIPPVFSVFLL